MDAVRYVAAFAPADERVLLDGFTFGCSRDWSFLT
jgi:hypothetical protein